MYMYKCACTMREQLCALSSKYACSVPVYLLVLVAVMYSAGELRTSPNKLCMFMLCMLMFACTPYKCMHLNASVSARLCATLELDYGPSARQRSPRHVCRESRITG